MTTSIEARREKQQAERARRVTRARRRAQAEKSEADAAPPPQRVKSTKHRTFH